MTAPKHDDQLAEALRRLPNFSAIRPAEIVADLARLLERNRHEIDTLLGAGGDATWASFVTPFEDIGDRLNRAWSPIGHLHSVADNESLRVAYNDAVPMLSHYGTDLAHNDALFAVFRQLRSGDHFDSLSSAQQMVIENALRDFRLGGIDLNADRRDQFRAINAELAQLSTRFEENVLDATAAWIKEIDDLADLAGLPDGTLALTRQNAAKRARQGYVLTLDFPCYLPVMTYCDNREIRHEMYDAYSTRASDQGPHAGRYDNSDTIDRILALRYELARLIGFANYAEYSLVTKMAVSTDAVIAFLDDLAVRSLPAAQRELAQLTQFAQDEVGLNVVEAWDLAYYSEKLRQKTFAISAEALRPYFPVDGVIVGLFDTVNRLFGIKVEPMEDIDRWHPDVNVYQVRDASGSLRGIFYLDLYAREHKRGGAWMDECIVRRVRAGIVQTPAAYLTCNFTPPLDGAPTLLTHDEVTTLFHEFGHGLHHMLTQVDYAAVSGINGVPWDGVELPSQFLENFCWERVALDTISGHFESGEPIPDELLKRMHAAKSFQAGMQMVRQIELALFDMCLYADYAPTISVQAVLDGVRDRVAVVKPPPYNRFQHSFSHIFAGGYAAGYYSYKWAEVLSADAFSRFEEEGIFNSDTGRSFLECILERGGSEDMMVLFERFRGRGPRIDALLRHAGL